MKNKMINVCALFLVPLGESTQRQCSPFISLMYVIIALAKWIISLNFSVCSVNDSSMQFTTEVTTLSSPIKWKADAKLLKQQLLYDFWWHFITGAAGWNCTVCCYFFINNQYYKYLKCFSIITPKCFLLKFFIEI